MTAKKRDDAKDASLRARKESGDARQLNVIIPADLHKRLKLRAVIEDASMAEIVTRALGEYLPEE